MRGHRRRRRRRRRERGAAGPVWSGHLTQLSHMCFTAPGRPPTRWSRSPRRRPLRPSPPSVGCRAAGPRPPSESASERGPPALASPLPAALPCFFSARSRALAWSDWSPGPGPRESRPTARAFLSPGLWARQWGRHRPRSSPRDGGTVAGTARAFIWSPGGPGPWAPGPPVPVSRPCHLAMRACAHASGPRAPRLTGPHRAPRPRPAPPPRAQAGCSPMSRHPLTGPDGPAGPAPAPPHRAGRAPAGPRWWSRLEPAGT